MDQPAELRHQLYRDLFFAGRTRREQLRGQIGLPASAIAFAVYAFGAFATHLSLGPRPSRRKNRGPGQSPTRGHPVARDTS